MILSGSRFKGRYNAQRKTNCHHYQWRDFFEQLTIKYTIRPIVCEASWHPVLRSFSHLVIRFKFLKDSHDKEKRELKSCSSGFLKLLPISVKKAELLSQVIKMQEIIEHIESCPLLSSFPFLFTDYPSAVWCEGVTLSRISNYVLSTIHTIYFGLNTAS